MRMALAANGRKTIYCKKSTKQVVPLNRYTLQKKGPAWYDGVHLIVEWERLVRQYETKRRLETKITDHLILHDTKDPFACHKSEIHHTGRSVCQCGDQLYGP